VVSTQNLTIFKFGGQVFPERKNLTYNLPCVPYFYQHNGYCFYRNEVNSTLSVLELHFLNLTTEQVTVLQVYQEKQPLYGFPHVEETSWNNSKLYLLFRSRPHLGLKLTAFEVQQHETAKQLFLIDVTKPFFGIKYRLLASSTDPVLTIFHISRDENERSAKVYRGVIDLRTFNISREVFLGAETRNGFLEALNDNDGHYFVCHFAEPGIYSIWTSKSHKRIFMLDSEFYTDNHHISSVWVDAANQLWILWTNPYQLEERGFIEVYDHELTLRDRVVLSEKCGNSNQIIEWNEQKYIFAYDTPHWYLWSLKTNPRLIPTLFSLNT